MNYTQAVDFIHSRQRFSSTPGLDRIKRITSLCGNPQRSMRFIHIAGTNGKGSTSVMISNILTAAGYRTGLSTSPYITDFRERFRIDGELISEEELTAITEQLYPIITKLDSEGVVANEFEVVIAITLLWFAQKGCDYAVLEVGLGGRYDATNVIDAPECAVITHIDLDHTAILGDTVQQIATEKCGIIKKGCKVVAYPHQYQDAAKVISDTCEALGCPFIIPQIPAYTTDLSGAEFEYKGTDYSLCLVGDHQVLNAVTAIEAALSIGIDPQYISQGIAAASMPARVEVVSKTPLIILDGAHNPDGMRALAKVLDRFGGQNPVAVIGMLKDKDCTAAVSEVAPKFSQIITVAVDNPRTMTAAELKDCLSPYCDRVIASDSIDAALALADEIKGESPLVICGSLYLASQIRPMLPQKQNN